MKQTGQFSIIGAAGNKGTYEGTPYDYTRLKVLMPAPAAKGESVVGSDRVIVPYGKQENYAKFKDREFPINVEAEYQFTTDGLEFLAVKFLPVNNQPKA